MSKYANRPIGSYLSAHSLDFESRWNQIEAQIVSDNFGGFMSDMKKLVHKKYGSIEEYAEMIVFSLIERAREKFMAVSKIKGILPAMQAVIAEFDFKDGELSALNWPEEMSPDVQEVIAEPDINESDSGYRPLQDLMRSEEAKWDREPKAIVISIAKIIVDSMKKSLDLLALQHRLYDILEGKANGAKHGTKNTTNKQVEQE